MPSKPTLNQSMGDTRVTPLHSRGCRICGATPLTRDGCVFKLCREHVDLLFGYVHEPTQSEAMLWLDLGVSAAQDLRRRVRLMRARYAAAVRLLGWEVAA